MDKIKTPVTYRIYDPDRFKFAVYKDPNGVLSPEQIANALNTAADQSWVIEELKTAATNLVNTIEAAKMLEAIWIGSNRRDEELEQIVGAKNIVKAALAEAQRIMEGKC